MSIGDEVFRELRPDGKEPERAWGGRTRKRLTNLVHDHLADEVDERRHTGVS